LAWPKSVEGMALSQVKAFTNVSVSDDGGDTLGVVSHPRASLQGIMLLLHGAIIGANIVHLCTCDDDVIGVVPSLEAPHQRPDLVMWWRGWEEASLLAG
jgi:hypothetical protein